MHRRASFLSRPNKYSFFQSVSGVDMKNHWYVMNTFSFYTWYVFFTLSRSALMLPPPWSLPGFNRSHILLQITCFYHIMLYWDILHIQLTPVRPNHLHTRLRPYFSSQCTVRHMIGTKRWWAIESMNNSWGRWHFIHSLYSCLCLSLTDDFPHL